MASSESKLESLERQIRFAGVDLKKVYFIAGEFEERQSKKRHPGGKFGKHKIFTCSEDTISIRQAQTPTKTFPYTQMTVARGRYHLIEYFYFTPQDREFRELDRASKAYKDAKRSYWFKVEHVAICVNELLKLSKDLRKQASKIITRHKTR